MLSYARLKHQFERGVLTLGLLLVHVLIVYGVICPPDSLRQPTPSAHQQGTSICSCCILALLTFFFRLGANLSVRTSANQDRDFISRIALSDVSQQKILPVTGSELPVVAAAAGAGWAVCA